MRPTGSMRAPVILPHLTCATASVLAAAMEQAPTAAAPADISDFRGETKLRTGNVPKFVFAEIYKHPEIDNQCSN